MLPFRSRPNVNFSAAPDWQSAVKTIRFCIFTGKQSFYKYMCCVGMDKQMDSTRRYSSGRLTERVSW